MEHQEHYFLKRSPLGLMTPRYIGQCAPFGRQHKLWYINCHGLYTNIIRYIVRFNLYGCSLPSGSPQSHNRSGPFLRHHRLVSYVEIKGLRIVLFLPNLYFYIDLYTIRNPCGSSTGYL